MSSEARPSASFIIDRQAFCKACGRFATGITVCTVLDASGAPHGMTANSFTSVSLDPPMVLICVDHRARILEHFRAAKYFGINILSEQQRHLSAHFARSVYDRFDGVSWYAGEMGVPLLPEVIGTIECEIRQLLDVGDHAVIIGEVLHADWQPGEPLIYYASGYRKLAT